MRILWPLNTYGTPIVILGSGAAGVFAHFYRDYMKSLEKQKKETQIATNHFQQSDLHGFLISG